MNLLYLKNERFGKKKDSGKAREIPAAGFRGWGNKPDDRQDKVLQRPGITPLVPGMRQLRRGIRRDI
jgi:hypothetical protein